MHMGARIGVKCKETFIGELDGSVSLRAQAVTKAFEADGLRAIVSDNILGTIWDKLLVNVAIGALVGIKGLTYGDLYAVPEIEQAVLAAVAEAIAVAQAQGVPLRTTDLRQVWLEASTGQPPQFRTSMLQSLEEDFFTEVDFSSGAVGSQGQRRAVPTPVNPTLVACIQGNERRPQAA